MKEVVIEGAGDDNVESWFAVPVDLIVVVGGLLFLFNAIHDANQQNDRIRQEIQPASQPSDLSQYMVW